MLGFYENFPQNIHHLETFIFAISNKKIQQKLTQTIQELNKKTYSFEEVGNPTVPNCTILFEFGIADTGNFTFLNEQEAEKLQNKITKESLRIIDWFCSIRYYKNTSPKKTPLKFDYYMIRFAFEKNSIQFSVFHERGPRYISPEELASLIVNQTNSKQKKTLLRRNTS